ncbi:MAG: hypothetical protein QXP27_06470 [Candidatus Methanomethyliaceae archaeon]
MPVKNPLPQRANSTTRCAFSVVMGPAGRGPRLGRSDPVNASTASATIPSATAAATPQTQEATCLEAVDLGDVPAASRSGSLGIGGTFRPHLWQYTAPGESSVPHQTQYAIAHLLNSNFSALFVAHQWGTSWEATWNGDRLRTEIPRRPE